MKVLVAIKRVVDYNVKVRPKPDGSDVDLANAKMSINPFCEIAVEEAVRLKEKGAPKRLWWCPLVKNKHRNKFALHCGADRGVHVQVDTALEPLAVAKCLSAVVKNESPELVILGKQSIDGDNNQTGQMLAALTGMPQATFASEVSLADGTVSVTREIDGGLETLKLSLPAVVTTDLRLNEPRYAALPNIMKAKKKPLETISPDSLELIHLV